MVLAALAIAAADRVWSAAGTDPLPRQPAFDPIARASASAAAAAATAPRLRVAFPWDGQVLSTSKTSRIRVLFDVERFEAWNAAQICLRAHSLGNVPCMSLAQYGQYSAETGGSDAMYELNALAPGAYVMYAELLSADGRSTIATSPEITMVVTSGRATTVLAPPPRLALTPIVLELQKIDGVEYRRYAHLVRSQANFLNLEYFAAAAGEEHYRLLATLAELCSTPGGPAFFDLGTFYGLSAFALGSAPHARVVSFDVEDRAAKIAALNGVTTAAFRAAVPNVEFRVQNIMMGDGEARRMLLRAPLVLLDTFHEPNTVPFEQEVIDFMIAKGFRGIVVVDDVRAARACSQRPPSLSLSLCGRTIAALLLLTLLLSCLLSSPPAARASTDTSEHRNDSLVAIARRSAGSAKVGHHFPRPRHFGHRSPRFWRPAAHHLISIGII